MADNSNSNNNNNKFEALLTRLLETNNDSVFTRKFTANRRDTLPYIFAMESFLRIQNITDTTIAFRKVIKSLDEGHRDLFMSDHVREDKLTVNMLKIWLLDRYPPPPMRHEWIIRLKQIRMRKNEDPLLVYQKFNTILEKVDRAIAYLNLDLDEDSSKRIPIISDELKHEILSGIFIRNNNQIRCNNEGTINKRTREYIAKVDPTCFKDWKPIFISMELDLIPQCYQTLPEWQYQTYSFCANDYEIYLPPKDGSRLHKKSSQKDDDHNRKRKQLHSDQNDKDKQPPRKRQRSNTCNICGKRGHYSYDCRYKQKKKDRDDRPPRKFCKRCKRDNHHVKDCRATRYKDGVLIRDDKSDRIREQYRSKRDRESTRDRSDRYRSKRGRRYDSKSRSRSRSRDRSDRGRWGNKSDDKNLHPDKKDDLRRHNKSYQRSIATLSKEINEDLDLDAEQAEQIQGYLTKISKISARHS